VFIVRTRPTMIYSIGHRGQWLKWLCEAGAGGLTWQSQVAGNPIPIPHPTNLALSGHKITLSIQSRGLILLQGGLKSEQGSCPLPPHFEHWARAMCTLPAVPRSAQPSTLRGTVNDYQLSGWVIIINGDGAWF